MLSVFSLNNDGMIKIRWENIQYYRTCQKMTEIAVSDEMQFRIRNIY